MSHAEIIQAIENSSSKQCTDTCPSPLAAPFRPLERARELAAPLVPPAPLVTGGWVLLVARWAPAAPAAYWGRRPLVSALVIKVGSVRTVPRCLCLSFNIEEAPKLQGEGWGGQIAWW